VLSVNISLSSSFIEVPKTSVVQTFRKYMTSSHVIMIYDVFFLYRDHVTKYENVTPGRAVAAAV
jgi:hypothetical protein